jgi:hypothetical protein
MIITQTTNYPKPQTRIQHKDNDGSHGSLGSDLEQAQQCGRVAPYYGISTLNT